MQPYSAHVKKWWWAIVVEWASGGGQWRVNELVQLQQAFYAAGQTYQHAATVRQRENWIGWRNSGIICLVRQPDSWMPWQQNHQVVYWSRYGQIGDCLGVAGCKWNDKSLLRKPAANMPSCCGQSDHLHAVTPSKHQAEGMLENRGKGLQQKICCQVESYHSVYHTPSKIDWLDWLLDFEMHQSKIYIQHQWSSNPGFASSSAGLTISIEVYRK